MTPVTTLSQKIQAASAGVRHSVGAYREIVEDLWNQTCSLMVEDQAEVGLSGPFVESHPLLRVVKCPSWSVRTGMVAQKVWSNFTSITMSLRHYESMQYPSLAYEWCQIHMLALMNMSHSCWRGKLPDMSFAGLSSVASFTGIKQTVVSFMQATYVILVDPVVNLVSTFQVGGINWGTYLGSFIMVALLLFLLLMRGVRRVSALIRS